MPQPRPWRDEIIDVIQLLGGRAHYSDIYTKIYERQIMNLDNNSNWEALVRNNIERFSKDSKAFGGKENIFYSAKGKGKGVWGLNPGYSIKNNDIVPLEVLERRQNIFKKSISALSDEQLKLKAKNSSNYEPRRRKASTPVFERNIYVSEYAKRRANGFCQLCGAQAPFLDRENKPYLESHHIIWLSKGGADTIENTVALCPNCHRKMHILNLNEDVNKLFKVIS